MAKWQKISLLIVILALLVLTIVFWGSVASVLFVCSLLYCVVIYLWNRFINVDRENEFDDMN